VETYSTYEAKARFSEIIRKVRAGRSVVVTHHGRQVAEIRPVNEEPLDLAARLERLERDGSIVRAAATGRRLRVAARRRGALARFIRSRD
jgi:prevent-host-death family protein